MKIVLSGGVFLALFLYEIISLPAYLHFGNKIEENVLNS